MERSHILFYDGECRLCCGIVQLALRHDRSRLWRYSPLQSEFAAHALGRYGVVPGDLDQIHVLAEHGTERERLLSGSDAGIFLWRSLSGWPRILGALLALIPRLLREPAYRVIARYRYRLFGRHIECRPPSTEQRALFVHEAGGIPDTPQAGEVGFRDSLRNS
jgi:predicted DCC family thiol-disulfide oxidoreductase YuxK